MGVTWFTVILQAKVNFNVNHKLLCKNADSTTFSGSVKVTQCREPPRATTRGCIVGKPYTLYVVYTVCCSIVVSWTSLNTLYSIF